MDVSATADSGRRRGRRRGAAAIGAAALALGVAAATAGPASAGEASAARATPAPGWSPTVEERCVVLGPGSGPDGIDPGHGPVVFEPVDVVIVPGDGPPEGGEHRPVDRVIVAHGGTEPGWRGGDGDHLRHAPRPGCDEFPAFEPGSEPVRRDR